MPPESTPPLRARNRALALPGRVCFHQATRAAARATSDGRSVDRARSTDAATPRPPPAATAALVSSAAMR